MAKQEEVLEAARRGIIFIFYFHIFISFFLKLGAAWRGIIFIFFISLFFSWLNRRLCWRRRGNALTPSLLSSNSSIVTLVRTCSIENIFYSVSAPTLPSTPWSVLFFFFMFLFSSKINQTMAQPWILNLNPEPKLEPNLTRNLNSEPKPWTLSPTP